MPRKTDTHFDLLGKDLVDHMRRQADRRIGRSVKDIDLGLVISLNPLQIQARTLTTMPVILDAEDVLVIPGVPIGKGMTVSLIRTKNDEVIAVPIIIGKDITPSPSFTGTPGTSGTDPNNTSVQSEPSVSGPAGQRVIAKALSYVGTKETSTNSDSGGKIDEWIERWGDTPGPAAPWCGYFVDAMYFEAGVNDEGLGDPYTGNITSRAKTANRWRTSNPIMGCMAVKGTQHVTLYISGPMEQADCVGGNQSNSVSRVTYDIRGWDLCVPAAILVDATNSTAATTSNGSGGAASPRPTIPTGSNIT